MYRLMNTKVILFDKVRNLILWNVYVYFNREMFNMDQKIAIDRYNFQHLDPRYLLRYNPEVNNNHNNKRPYIQADYHCMYYKQLVPFQ